MLPAAYQSLVNALDGLPAVGPKAAERLAQYLLNSGHSQVLLDALNKACTQLRRCNQCRLYTEQDSCIHCRTAVGAQPVLVLANINHYQQALDKGWKARFFILHGLLSPMVGVGPKQLEIDKLVTLATTGQASQFIVALEPSAEGRATSAFITSTVLEVPVLTMTWQQWLTS